MITSTQTRLTSAEIQNILEEAIALHRAHGPSALTLALDSFRCLTITSTRTGVALYQGYSGPWTSSPERVTRRGQVIAGFHDALTLALDALDHARRDAPEGVEFTWEEQAARLGVAHARGEIDRESFVAGLRRIHGYGCFEGVLADELGIERDVMADLLYGTNDAGETDADDEEAW